MPSILNGRLRAMHGVCVCVFLSALSPAAAQDPRIEVAPAALQFGSVILGRSSTLTVELANVGTAPLLINRVEAGTSGSDDFSLSPVALPINLPPAGRRVVGVIYTPDVLGRDDSTLVIASNDPARPVVTVSLSGRGDLSPDPVILVSPASVDFVGTPVGSTTGRSVTIRNGGIEPLIISSLQITQGMDRSFQITSGISLPLELRRSGSVRLQITYTPVRESLDFARLMIESNDADRPVVSVTLTGRGVLLTSAQIAVTPSSLDFGEVLVGLPGSLSLTMANGGLRQLRITNIAIDPESSPAFAVTGGPVTATLTTGEALSVEVRYSPPEAADHIGMLRIESNDAAAPLVTVGLSGSGVLPVFRRGDANSDGEVDLSDAISVLGQLFGSVPAPLCLDASDVNDDAVIDISDAVFTLVWLFDEESVLPPPGGQSCGVDPTEDGFSTCRYPREICD